MALSQAELSQAELSQAEQLQVVRLQEAQRWLARSQAEPLQPASPVPSVYP